MAENESTPVEETEPQTVSPKAGKGSSIINKVKITAFITAVLLAECLVAYMYVPSAEEITAQYEAHISDIPDIGEEEEEQRTLKEEAIPTVEVDLGQYSVTAFQPLSNTTLRIDFRLYATVLVEEEADYLIAFEKHNHRFREQVLVTIRSSEITDLTDAGLGLIKRKILEKTNRVLDRPFLKEIVFSDFSFVEQ